MKNKEFFIEWKSWCGDTGMWLIKAPNREEAILIAKEKATHFFGTVIED